MTILFLITTIIFAVMFLVKHISLQAIIYYLHQKEYTLPTDEELKECTSFVVRHLFK